MTDDLRDDRITDPIQMSCLESEPDRWAGDRLFDLDDFDLSLTLTITAPSMHCAASYVCTYLTQLNISCYITSMFFSTTDVSISRY